VLLLRRPRSLSFLPPALSLSLQVPSRSPIPSGPLVSRPLQYLSPLSFPSLVVSPYMPTQYGNNAPYNIFPGKLFPNIFSGIIFSSTVPSCTHSSSALSLFPTVPSITNVSDAEFVLYTHWSFGSPVLSTFLAATRAGWLKSIPRLTPQLVLLNPPLALATSLGYLDACVDRVSTPPALPPLPLLLPLRATNSAS
jgi:hypothetical protein